jgi:hypothetical protein
VLYLHVPMLITVRVKLGLSGHSSPDLVTARTLLVLTSQKRLQLVRLAFGMQSSTYYRR